MSHFPEFAAGLLRWWWTRKTWVTVADGAGTTRRCYILRCDFMCQQRSHCFLARSSNPKMEAIRFIETSINFIEMHSSTSQIIPLQEPQIQQDYKLQVKWDMKTIKIIVIWDVTECFEASLQCYGETSCCCLRSKRLLWTSHSKAVTLLDITYIRLKVKILLDAFLAYSCALNMETISPFETSVNFYRTTRRHVPHSLHNLRHESL
jgi:hypothetical protein